MNKPSPIRFGNCTVDLQARTLLKGGEPQPFEPKGFDALVYLIAHRDRVVTKQELLDTVWGRHVVLTSGVVSRTIMKARRLAGQTGSGELVIKTIHRIGYRFVAELEQGGQVAANALHPELAASVSLKSRYPLIAILPVNNTSTRPDLAWTDLGLMAKVIDPLSS